MSGMAKKRAAKKDKQQKNLSIGAFAMATVEKRKVSTPSTPSRKRRATGPSTPQKRPRIIVDKEQEAEKRRINKKLELRKQVLGATNPRERALALAQEALANGIIKP